MNRRKFAVSLLALLILALFGLGIWSYQQSVQKAQTQAAEQQADRLVRPHAPAFGPASAPVTIVEFFDPACETCRAFYPIVKDILRQYPQEVRLVIRYAPFHAGSDQVIQMLETARLQDKYQPVLEALLAKFEVQLELEPATQPPSIVDDVNRAVEGFELDHPGIAGTLRNIVITLGNIGI